MNIQVLSFYRNMSRLASGLVVTIGLLVLVGWLFDIPVLTSMFPGMATMKANTALAFVLGGVSLCQITRELRDQRLDLIAKACATGMLLIGLLTLVEYVFGPDFGIDQLLFKEELTPQNAYPGRMSPATALSLLLLGCALLVIDNRWSNWLKESFTITAVMIAGVAVIGYLYGVSSLYQISVYASMALHTAVTFILLGLGILCARPEHGFISSFSTEGAAGILIRRLLPAAIGLPVLLGWLILSGQRLGQYDIAFAIALFAVLNLIIFSGLIRWNADMLHLAEVERIQSRSELLENEKRYRRFFENMHETFVIQEIIMDNDGKPIDLRFLDLNPAAERILGKSRSELVGRTRSEVAGQPDPEGVEMASRVASTGVPFHMVRSSPGFGRSFESFTYSLGSGIVATLSLDITERKKAEEALSLSEQRLRALTENSWDAIALFGADGTILYGSPSTVQILGYSLDEFIGRNAFELIHEEDQALVTERLTTSLQQPGAHIPVYARVRHKNGEWRWLEGVFTNLLDEPSVQAIVNNYHDFTERKLAEEVIRGSEERFRLIVEAAPSAMIVVDRDGKIDLVNAKAQELFGYGKEELLGRSVEMLVPERFRREHPNYRQNFLAQPTSRPMGAGRDLFGLHKNGHEVPIEIGLTPYESSEGQFTLALIADITERKQAEEKIAYQAYLLENVNDAVIGSDENTLIRFWNQGAERTFGWKAEEVLGRSGREFLRSEFINSDRETVLKILAEQGRWRGESISYRKDGSQVNLEVSSITLRDANGIITGYLSVNRDITERKQAEEALQKSKERFSKAFQSSPAGLVISSLVDGRLVEVNDTYLRMTGYQREEVIGRTTTELNLTSSAERTRLIERLREQDQLLNFEMQLQTKSGRLVDMLFSAIQIELDGVKHLLSTTIDITDRKRAQEKIHRQNERLKVLREIDTAILAADSIENIVSAALNHISDLIACRRANLTLIDWETNESVVFDMSAVNETSIPKGRRFPLAQYQDIIQALSQDQLLLMNDLPGLADPRPAIQSLLKDGLRSLCSLPLSSQGKLIGMFSIYSEVPYYFDEDKISLGREIANQVAIAITHNNLLHELRDLNAELEQRVAERTAALSQANSLLQMMLDNMPDQIYFKDAQSRFIRNSRSQAKALGLSDPAEAIGKSDFDFFTHAQQSFEKEQEIIRSGRPLVDQEERVVWPDGKETWVSTTKVPMRDQGGQIIGTFGISRDITERKRTEIALQKAKLEMEAANKELEAFSYSVSHDLRAPLRSLDGFSQALLEDYGEMLPPEGRNFLERIRSSAQRMAELIDDLLNLSKVTRASMKLVPVDLSQLAQGIIAELQHTNRERRVNFMITPNLKARGDPGLLQAVLENLLNNAWKFTSKREQAEIEFGSKYDNDETIYFIRDNGAGFDMAYAGKLFGAFQRLHAMTEFSGTGIGLATVQRIINRHGGRIWAEGAVDQGATFFFTLPALERVRPQAEPIEKDSLNRRVREII